MPPIRAWYKFLDRRFLCLLLNGCLACVVLGQSPYPINVFPSAPRELRQYLTRAQTALTEERYSDAVQELGQILNTAESDDFFLGMPGTADAQVSLKTQALELLGSMPPRGRRLYELQSGADAKAALEEALNAGDLVRLTDVCRRYFHTKAGYEAALLLGRVQLDQGRALAAATTLKRVADVPFAAAQYDPELSVLLAASWMYAHEPTQAKETLLALKQRLPQAKVRLVDKEVALFDRDEAALSWLEKIVGASRSGFVAAATEWVMYRGDERRNAESTGGVPLLNFNWKLPTINDPGDEARVAQRYRMLRDRGEPLICALQPLVVQDYAIIRQPESNKLVGINLKNSKRAWIFPPFDDNPSAQTARQNSQAGRAPAINAREEELKQRVWEDHAFGQISSDGRQVYVIDDLGFAEAPNMNSPRMFVGRRGQIVPNTSGAKPHNLLVALDLAKQGYQVWAVGGTTGDNPALAGAFFLGAPLPLGGQLYVLAEFNGEVRLVCLDARTGNLEWKQQLAVLDEQMHIASDRLRRLAGASPSLADGVLICPTSTGAVVAVDLATRTLRWGYQYGRTDVALVPQSRFGSRMSLTSSDSGHWLDATATIAEGNVILTPVESQQIHCLDLLTGKAKWAAQPRDDLLFVGCVHRGKIVLIGKDRLKAINLADGSAAWPSELKLTGQLCAGRGYYSDKYYHLPVTGQQLLKIDLDEGKVVSKAQTEVELGNIVCYRDQLISQSPQMVASFTLLSEQLQKQLEERLAANTGDIEALSLKAQILLQEGEPDESLKLLRRASQLAPEKATVRSLLVKVMFSLLRQDLQAHLTLTDELDKLVTEPAQRREVLRWRVKGLASANRSWDAFQALMELADQELTAAPAFESSSGLESVDNELAVRSDRWLQGQLHKLWQGADAATRERMTLELKTRLERALSSSSPSPLRAFLNLFGFHSVSDAARLALVEKLIGTEGWLEAELLLGEVVDAPEPEVRGAAHAALAVLYEKAKRPELAAREYQRLGAAFTDVVCRDGLTGHRLLERAVGIPAVQAYLTANWPVGQVEANVSDANNSNPLVAFQKLSYPVPIVQFSGAAVRGLRASYDPQQQNLLAIRGDFGETLATASLRRNNSSTFYPAVQNYAMTAKANGHLVVVNMGAEVTAVDGLRGERGGDGLLWRQDAVDSDPNVQKSFYPQQRAANNPLTGNRLVSYDPTGKVNFNTAPVLGVGFCFQRGRQLICVDPLSGQTLWERSPIPQQVEIFGDGEMLFIADAGGENTLVLSAIDGSLLEKRKIDKAERRWATHGRRVLAWDQSGSSIQVRLYDAWAQGDDLWSRKVSQGTRGCLIDGEEVALLEPSGEFSVVSLATGEVRFSTTLEPEPSLAWIQVIRSSAQHLLLASQENNEQTGVLIQPMTTAGSQHTRMHGRVYAFDGTTGRRQWQTPAFVAQHCLPADQPSESPLLFFVRNRTSTNQGNATTKASLLALDRRDGRLIYDSDSAGNAVQNCDCLVDPTKQLVTLTLHSNGSKAFAFRFTEKPVPPQPPAQTGLMASDTASQPPGRVDRSINSAIDALNRGLIVPPPERRNARAPR